MELRTLRYFLAVCEQGTMSRAAEVLHVTQPALSRQIAALERELGCALLERHSRSVTPTEQGLYLQRRAREIVGLTNQTEADLKQRADIVEGDIHIGAGESDGIRVIAARIRAFRARHPGVRFHVHSGNAPDLIERLERGLDDFSVLMSHPGIDRYAHLRLAPTDAWGILMRDDDPLAARDSVGPADLAGASLILPERFAQADEVTGLFATWLGDQANAPHVAATVNLAFNGAVLVREGVGSMLTYEGLTPAGPGTGLAFRLLFPPLISVIDFAWKRDAPLGDAARRFLAFVREDEGER